MFNGGKIEKVTFTRRFADGMFMMDIQLWGVDNFTSMLRFCRDSYMKDIMWSFEVNGVVIAQSKNQ